MRKRGEAEGGKIGEEVKHSSRCAYSLSKRCRCSCGGKLHGFKRKIAEEEKKEEEKEKEAEGEEVIKNNPPTITSFFVVGDKDDRRAI